MSEAHCPFFQSLYRGFLHIRAGQESSFLERYEYSSDLSCCKFEVIFVSNKFLPASWRAE